MIVKLPPESPSTTMYHVLKSHACTRTEGGGRGGGGGGAPRGGCLDDETNEINNSVCSIDNFQQPRLQKLNLHQFGTLAA